MASGSSDQVRSLALEKYVRPAILAGRTHFSVSVKDLMKDLQVTGFPAGNYPQICTALRTGKFLRENGLEIEGVDGPPSGLSTTVVVRYRLIVLKSSTENRNHEIVQQGQRPIIESNLERAMRAAGRLRGRFKDELAEYGGGEAFLRWMRSEGDEAPPGKQEP